MKHGIRRAIVFGIDGAGTFFDQTDTPVIAELEARGAACHRALTEIPTVSAECWGGILHGTDCHRHRLTNWITGCTPFPSDSPYPSVFRAIRESMPDAELASFVDWGNINIGIVENDLGVYKYQAKDYDLVEPAREYIRNHDFTMMFFQFDSVDHEGHAHGYGSKEHLEQITRNDGYIGRILEAVEERGWTDETMVVVVADHGGTPEGSHGGTTDAEKYVCVYFAGGHLKRGPMREMRTKDIPAAILYALGIPQPKGWDGTVPADLFEDAPDGLPRPEGLPLTECIGYVAKAFPGNTSPEERLGMQPVIHVGPRLPDDAEKHGKLYQISVKGRDGIRLDDGWFSVPMKANMPAGDFTLTCMLYQESGMGRSVIAATGPDEETHARDGQGFCWTISENYMDVTCWDGESGKIRSASFGLPEEAGEDWMFLILSYDHQNHRLLCSANLAPFVSCNLPETQTLSAMGDRLFIGQDSVQSAAAMLPATLAGFSIYDRLLTDADLERMRGR